ncbi:hypothetical protein BKA82DRAFT_4023816 [Pisolithus tinctorius]|nr:hypothetical protein BKA82DRAFT_4023816 [Pisolithus tinctorius]
MVNHLSGSEEEHQSNASDDSFVNVHGLSVAPSHPPHQDSSQESGVPSVHDIIMCSMARPTTWAMAYQTLGTLWYETWIDASILNFHLQSQCGGTHALPDAQEIQFFHQHHLFDSHPANPSVPIAFVVMQNSHFFVAVFDYWLNLAFILGRHIERVLETPHPHYDPLHDDWNRWNGPFYWTCIASLHRFDAIDPTQVDVQVYNWSQNGFNCGPIASFVMESLMSGGLSGDGRPTIHIPPIPCGHRLHLRMLVMWDDTEAISEDILMDVENQSSGEQHATIVWPEPGIDFLLGLPMVTESKGNPLQMIPLRSSSDASMSRTGQLEQCTISHVQLHWFDEYEGGPVLESLHQDHNCNKIVEEPYYRPGRWTSFLDYGYRLLSSFNQMIYLGPPIRLSDHVLQVGVPANYQSSHQISDHVTGNYSLAWQVPHPSRVHVDDVVILGASQMIKIGSSTSEHLMNTFVNGWHKDGCHICLDLDLDHKLVTPEELEVTVDINSLIWVTHSLQFNTLLPIYLGPIVKEKAPMHKHNHVMIHRDEMTHKHANHIPKEVLDFFWEHVLLPAIHAHADVSRSAVQGMKGWQNQEGWSAKSSLLFYATVEADPEDHGGNHPRGPFMICKLWFLLLHPGMQGNQVVDENHPVRSALDWSHMVDRANGELLVDLGISIHPTCDEKLVGLWRLDALEASFGAGGYLSAYNLAYEVIQPNDKSPTFVMDKDAYALNNDFIRECMQAINMYSGDAKKRSYGMEELLASNPILWILTKVWLEFMAGCIRALQLAQISLKELEPPNLGILTGIICHMIWCTSTTAIILDFHVRESMALLQVSRQTDMGQIDKDHPTAALVDHAGLEVVSPTVQSGASGSEGKPEPTSLEDAIQSWTLNQTFRTIHACEFKACNAEIAGSGGAGPTVGQPSWRSPWNVFWTKPGYIWEYHQVMKNRTPLEEFEVLDHHGRIFSVLQTLPDVTKGSEKSPGKTWQVEGEKVVLVTNPKFYKIKGISTEKEQQQARRRASRVEKPRNALQMELLEHAGYDELLASQALILERQRLKEAQTKKSSKAKNARKPPARRGKALHRVEGPFGSHQNGPYVSFPSSYPGGANPVKFRKHESLSGMVVLEGLKVTMDDDNGCSIPRCQNIHNCITKVPIFVSSTYLIPSSYPRDGNPVTSGGGTSLPGMDVMGVINATEDNGNDFQPPRNSPTLACAATTGVLCNLDVIGIQVLQDLVQNPQWHLSGSHGVHGLLDGLVLHGLWTVSEHVSSTLYSNQSHKQEVFLTHFTINCSGVFVIVWYFAPNWKVVNGGQGVSEWLYFTF